MQLTARNNWGHVSLAKKLSSLEFRPHCLFISSGISFSSINDDSGSIVGDYPTVGFTG
jgi:hypothetical protein